QRSFAGRVTSEKWRVFRARRAKNNSRWSFAGRVLVGAQGLDDGLHGSQEVGVLRGLARPVLNFTPAPATLTRVGGPPALQSSVEGVPVQLVVMCQVAGGVVGIGEQFGSTVVLHRRVRRGSAGLLPKPRAKPVQGPDN